jgi:hypothetical protein
MMNRNAKSFTMMGAFVAMAAGSTVARAEDQVPFKAQFESAISFTSLSTATLAGKGLSSHLGKAKSEGSLAIVGPAPCDGGFAVEMTDVYTSASGDQVMVTIDMQACPVGANVYEGAGSYLVTGGTGRFAGASGAGTFTGLGDFGAGSVACNLNGTISPPSD